MKVRMPDDKILEMNEAKAAEAGLPGMVKHETEIRFARDREADGSPDSMPEIVREITILRGAVHSVQQRAAGLVVALAPVLGEDPDQIADRQEPGPTGQAPRTEIGESLRACVRELSQLESFLVRATQAVAL